MSALLEAALEYARRGWPVFPARLANGAKIPWLDHRAEDCPNGVGGCGYKHATCSEQQIRKWWTEKPDAWVAVSCEGAGWAVVDVDPRNGGVRPPNCTPTLLQQTMSGGEHLIYLAPPGGPGTGSLGPGVDVKYKGYVIVAPSPGYRWSHEVDPVPWPFGVQRGRNGHGGGGELSREKVEQGIPFGEHDTQLFKYAAELRGRGTVSLEEAKALLRGAAERCLPPTTPEQQAAHPNWRGYDPREAELKAERAWAKYEPGTTPEDRAAAMWLGAGKQEEAPEGEADEDDQLVQEEEDANWPVLGQEAYHGVVGEVVRVLLPATEADPVAIVAEFLVAWGNLIGAGPHIRLSGVQHPARIFGCLVGNSARARKSAAWGMVKTLLFQVDPDWYSRQTGGDGLSSGEGLIMAVRDSITRTVQGRERVDEGVADKRLLVHDPEFAGRTVSLIHREGSTLSAIVREAYDTGNLLNRKSEAIRATNAHISIMGHSTLEELGAKLSDVDLANGFANRFLFFPVKNSQSLPFGADPNPEAVHALVQSLQKRYVRAMQKGRVDYGISGRKVWAEHYDRMMSADGTGPLGHLTARSTIHAQRLSLLYAVLDDAEAIEAEHVEAAMAIVRYAYLGAKLILGKNSGTLGDRYADALLVYLLKEGRECTTKEAQLALGINGDRLSKARALLETKRLIKVAPGPRKSVLMRAY